MEIAQLREKLWQTPEFKKLSINDRFRVENTIMERISTRSTGTFRDVEWWQQFKQIIDPYAGDVTVTTANAIGIAAYKHGVELRAQSIASMARKLYKQTSDGRAVNTKHPLAKLLKNPNAFMTGYSFFRYMTASCVGKGNGYAGILRGPDYRPIQLLPIAPECVEPCVEGGELYYNVTHPGFPSKMPATEILHFKGMEWDNPLKGVSPIYIHRESLGTTLSANRYASKTYQTGRIMGIISSTLNLTTGQQETLRDTFEDVINGEASTTVIPGGGKFEQLSINPVDADYINYSNLSVEDINRMLNVPNKLVTEEEQIAFYTNTLLPDCVNFEQELDRKLLREDEQGIYYVKHQFNSLMRANATARSNFYTQALNNGSMSPNQIAALEDMPESEGGDEHYVQSNLVPIRQFPDWIESKINQNNSKQNPNPNGNNQDESNLT